MSSEKNCGCGCEKPKREQTSDNHRSANIYDYFASGGFVRLKPETVSIEFGGMGANPKIKPKVSITTAQAMGHVIDLMKKDKHYAWAWHSNIAVPLIDHLGQKVANERAAAIMENIFNVDMTGHSYYQELMLAISENQKVVNQASPTEPANTIDPRSSLYTYAEKVIAFGEALKDPNTPYSVLEKLGNEIHLKVELTFNQEP